MYLFVATSGGDDRHKNRYDTALLRYDYIVSHSITKWPGFAVFYRDRNFFFPNAITVTVSIPTDDGGVYKIYYIYFIIYYNL